MVRGVATILVAPMADVASLIAAAFGRAADVGVLRLLTLALTQALDLVTFAVMVARHGSDAEANPLVQNLYLGHGMVAVAAAKLALVVLVGALSVSAWSKGRRGIWPVVGGLPLALAIAAGLIGGITNTAAYLH